MQVIVLGMHRSGTSVLARMLNLMGLYLGPEGMSTGANPENPKGFWERRDVRLLNDAALHSVGCDWNRVADLDLGRIPENMAQAFDEVACRVLLEMDAHRPWFIKEPRLCVLLPLWLRHLEVPVVVNVHRDPVEVAASLHRRNGIPMEAGLELWEYYTRSAAAASRGVPAVSVLHGELMSAPEAVASRLHDDLVRLGIQAIRPASQRELAGFVDRRLHREQAARGGLDRYRDCRQARMYRSLTEGVDLGGEPDVRSAEWPALREYEKGLPAVQPSDPQTLRSSGYDAFMLDERLKSSVRRMNRMESGLAAKFEQQIQRIVDELRTAGRADAGPADEGAMSPPKPGHDALTSRLDAEIEGRERAERELDRRHAELAAAARELVAAEEKAAQLAATSDQQRKGRKAAEERLRKLQDERRADRARLEALHKQVEALEGKLAWLRKERKSLADSVARERDRNATMQTELAKLTGSWSWKAAAPLRALTRRLRNVPRR